MSPASLKTGEKLRRRKNRKMYPQGVWKKNIEERWVKWRERDTKYDEKKRKMKKKEIESQERKIMLTNIVSGWQKKVES